MNEIALLGALKHAWGTLNGTLFKGAMKPPALELSDGARLGAWKRGSRTLSLGRQLVSEQSWPVVVEVLKHEMAHQYVDEVLGADEAAHGAAFRRVCSEIGADPRAAGLPVADEEPRAVQKVRKLLALAQSGNRHEAEAAAKAAHRWMRKHNIDVLGDPTTFGARVVGRAAFRHQAWEKALAGIVAKHFFVHAVWVPAWLGERWGKQLELSGRPENLDLAEHVHALVSEVAERSWIARRKAHGSRGRERGRFLAGVVMGFGEQLEGQAEVLEETGLAWAGDAALDDWLGRRYPRLRAGRGVRVRGDSAWKSGRETGRGLVINRPIQGKSMGSFLPLPDSTKKR